MLNEDLLYPRSKFKILRALYYAAAPVPLREIAYRSDLVLGSVQSGIAQLIKENMVTRRKIDNRICLQLSNDSVRNMLAPLCTALTPVWLQSQADALKKRAVKVLPMLEERSSIISHARESLRS